jgi:hypothetical protein
MEVTVVLNKPYQRVKSIRHAQSLFKRWRRLADRSFALVTMVAGDGWSVGFSYVLHNAKSP